MQKLWIEGHDVDPKELIRLFPSLTHLRLDAQLAHYEPLALAVIVGGLPKLENLCIPQERGDTVSAIASCRTLSRLRVLSICGSDGHPAWIDVRESLNYLTSDVIDKV